MNRTTLIRSRLLVLTLIAIAVPPTMATEGGSLDRDAVTTILERFALDYQVEPSIAEAFSTDPAPMDIEAMEGFQPGPEFIDVILPTTFHFWTRGFPEVIPFGERYTRFTHGADAAVFYHQPGFRSAWGSSAGGQSGSTLPSRPANLP